MFFQTINEARRLHLEGNYKPTAVDNHLLETDLGEFAEYKGQNVPLDCPMHEEKDVELNSPKVGGPKKYYVYVKDPKTEKIKKITWGDTTGLKVKLGFSPQDFTKRLSASVLPSVTSSSRLLGSSIKRLFKGNN